MTDSNVGEPHRAIDDELLTYAIEVLQDVDDSTMPAGRWAAVAEDVAALSAAAEADDPARFGTALGELERFTPMRASTFGEDPAVARPEPVRQEINELIHTLDGRAAGSSD